MKRLASVLLVVLAATCSVLSARPERAVAVTSCRDAATQYELAESSYVESDVYSQEGQGSQADTAFEAGRHFEDVAKAYESDYCSQDEAFAAKKWLAVFHGWAIESEENGKRAEQLKDLEQKILRLLSQIHFDTRYPQVWKDLNVDYGVTTIAARQQRGRDAATKTQEQAEFQIIGTENQSLGSFVQNMSGHGYNGQPLLQSAQVSSRGTTEEFDFLVNLSQSEVFSAIGTSGLDNFYNAMRKEASVVYLQRHPSDSQIGEASIWVEVKSAIDGKLLDISPVDPVIQAK